MTIYIDGDCPAVRHRVRDPGNEALRKSSSSGDFTNSRSRVPGDVFQYG
jgi:hypothetical protein